MRAVIGFIETQSRWAAIADWLECRAFERDRFGETMWMRNRREIWRWCWGMCRERAQDQRRDVAQRWQWALDAEFNQDPIRWFRC